MEKILGLGGVLAPSLGRVPLSARRAQGALEAAALPTVALTAQLSLGEMKVVHGEVRLILN